MYCRSWRPLGPYEYARRPVCCIACVGIHFRHTSNWMLRREKSWDTRPSLFTQPCFVDLLMLLSTHRQVANDQLLVSWPASPFCHSYFIARQSASPSISPTHWEALSAVFGCWLAVKRRGCWTKVPRLRQHSVGGWWTVLLAAVQVVLA